MQLVGMCVWMCVCDVYMCVQIFDMVDAKARQDCIKEIDLLKQLNHPNVIKYLSSFVENNEVGVSRGWGWYSGSGEYVRCGVRT